MDGSLAIIIISLVWCFAGFTRASFFFLALVACDVFLWDGFFAYDLPKLMVTNDMQRLHAKLSPWPSPIGFELYSAQIRWKPVLPFISEDPSYEPVVRKAKQQLSLRAEALQIEYAKLKIPVPAFALLDLTRELTCLFDNNSNDSVFKLAIHLIRSGFTLEGVCLGLFWFIIPAGFVFACWFQPKIVLLVFFITIFVNFLNFYFVQFSGFTLLRLLAMLLAAFLPVIIFWILSKEGLARAFIFCCIILIGIRIQAFNGYDYTGGALPREVWKEDLEAFKRVQLFRQSIQLKGFSFQEDSKSWKMIWHAEERGDHIVNYPCLISKKAHNGGVFIIQHGVFDESRSWIPLADWLIRNSYAREVWLLNTKDNIFAANPRTVFSEKSSQWQLRDLAFETKHFVSKIAKVSKTDKVTYIGHSQGTAQLLTLLSLEPELSSMFENVILLAPVTIPDLSKADALTLRLVPRVVKIFRLLFKSGGVLPPRESPILRDEGLMASVGTWLHFARKTNGVVRLMSKMTSTIVNAFSSQFFEFAGLLVARPRGGIALSMLLNWAKIIDEKKFCDDLGDIPIQNILAPIHMIIAKHDWLSNVQHLKTIPQAHFYELSGESGHMDFVLPHMFQNLADCLKRILEK